MTYRKFKADYLFTGQVLAGSDSVLVVTDDGTVQAVVSAGEAGEGVEVYPGLLCPGFINCHCHLELSYLKGLLPERTGLVDFLAAVIRARSQAGRGAEAQRTGGEERAGGAAGILGVEQRVREAIDAGEREMLDGGIVAVGDICNTADTAACKAAGNLFYHNFIETMGFIEQGAAARFAHSLGVFNTFAGAYSVPIESNSIVPHAPYSVSGALFRMIADFPGNHLLTIHNQESEAENEFYQTGKGDLLRLYDMLGLDVSFFHGTGKNSLEGIMPYFYKNQSLILVHNVATGEDDLRAVMGVDGVAGGAAATGGPDLFFCLCPNANLYIGGQLPDAGLLYRSGCNIVVGTDSLASNHRLSILGELKTLQRAFPWLSTATLLQWATENGARALQMDAVLGSFLPGRQPGVLLIENLDGEKLGEDTGVRRLL